MANDPKDRINLAALQQNDPYIERIVETAGQVALYNFNAETNEWEKTDVQGTMFIYTRYLEIFKELLGPVLLVTIFVNSLVIFVASV
ncbi:mRNA-decapping enzyme 1B [Holothuria leucospilota]|uniref:mRNA-decapping enzyme 1B n=1 Tax=Holothuria leucospilota TaxID=206669 RepID=A0A9Q1CME4_HOLLE|nr:mRNA-decapping enzyme 1B [Holothuria leucospilota]